MPLRLRANEANGRKKSVKHLHFQEWPDFGCPENTHFMLQFCSTMRQHIEDDAGLTVVHCSAGVGRTGTLIALDILLQHIKENKKIDIFNTVYQLRQQRTNMVQTEVPTTLNTNVAGLQLVTPVRKRCISLLLSDNAYLGNSSYFVNRVASKLDARKHAISPITLCVNVQNRKRGNDPTRSSCFSSDSSYPIPTNSSKSLIDCRQTVTQIRLLALPQDNMNYNQYFQLQYKYIYQCLLEALQDAAFIHPEFVTGKLSSPPQSPEPIYENMLGHSPYEKLVKLASDWAVQGQLASNRAVQGQLASDWAVQGQLATNRAVQGQLASDWAVQGQLASNRAVQGQLASNRAVQGQLASNRAVQGQLATNRAVQGQLASDWAVQGQLASNKSKYGTKNQTKRLMSNNVGCNLNFFNKLFRKDCYISLRRSQFETRVLPYRALAHTRLSERGPTV
uniref:protein-tyrosine-phosphatase n=1 Tax=Timema poppense TaxID=170557 RepID=A0A7R9D8A9_TIMPO|nr:unnamed protein product [Timema poppensis]